MSVEPKGFQTWIIYVDLYHNKEIKGGHSDLPSPPQSILSKSDVSQNRVKQTSNDRYLPPKPVLTKDVAKSLLIIQDAFCLL